jgi:hypothetical protein
VTTTALTATALTTGTVVEDVAGTAIDATKTMVITPTDRFDKLIFRFVHTTHAAKTLLIKAGTAVAANASGQGDLTVTLDDATAADVVTFLTGLESARFLQSDGSIHITFAASTTGFVTAFQLD